MMKDLTPCDSAGEHGLDEGFVVRFGEIRMDGTVIMRSYGEGDDFRQNMTTGIIWRPLVQEVWQTNHAEIIQSSN